MNKIKKLSLLKCSLSFSIIFCMLTISGCKANSNYISNISTSSVASSIKESVVFKDELQQIYDKDILKKIYPDINLDYISDFTVYISASGATAEEIAVFKLTNSNYEENVKQVIESRTKEQITNFENYVPEEVYKIKNSVTNIYKDIIVFVSCDTPSEVETILEKLYKKGTKN